MGRIDRVEARAVDEGERGQIEDPVRVVELVEGVREHRGVRQVELTANADDLGVVPVLSLELEVQRVALAAAGSRIRTTVPSER